ncbi:MAG: chorismate mutase [Clostridiales bacterium]|nr:chorismate mutase [Candidatus Apopatousia equi]
MEKDLLLKSRDEIDKIDTEILKLFEKRMSVVGDIAKYKFENNMEIFVPEREILMKQKNVAKLNNTELKEYYEELLNTFLTVSKNYQKKIIEDIKKVGE